MATGILTKKHVIFLFGRLVLAYAMRWAAKTFQLPSFSRLMV